MSCFCRASSERTARHTSPEVRVSGRVRVRGRGRGRGRVKGRGRVRVRGRDEMLGPPMTAEVRVMARVRVRVRIGLGLGGCAAPKSERISSRHALHGLVRVRARGKV